MPFRLDALRINRVATVDKPDNPPARIVLYKRKPQQDDRMPEKTDDLQAQLDAATEQIAALTKRAEAAEAKTAPPPDPIEKADPEVRAAIQKMQDDLAKAREQAEQDRRELAKIQEARERDAMIQKVQSDMKHIAKADDFAPWLLKIRPALGDEYDKFEATLKSLNTQLAESVLLSEQGHSVPSGDAEAQIDTLAKERVQKNAGVTYEQAVDAVLQEHPDLYQRSCEERRQRRAS